MSVLGQSTFIKDVTTPLHMEEPTVMLYGVPTDVRLSSGLVSEAVGLPVGLMLVIIGVALLYLSKRK